MAITGKENHPSYPMFKGLQRPLELMGLQGRYIYWAAAAAGGAIVGFIVMYIAMGFVAGLITLVAAIGVGVAVIMLKQRKGLHSKKCDKGVFVYARSRSL
ncbi:DUF4133 domain-containing protein [uncultured Muribaculum sp.]|jgi:hypothetical protein|uniref:DUF4133 domain-containing protein n=1 Tax=uncultured Muribaculum sp. TaxID=1918613 RepID=UPI00272DDD05|nr:DUF4133 domain-containing protein [uncultured Muribaculum sp.]MCI9607442.1 DUF4133 domain-containing protein [Muribaculaceae bacterium]